MAIKSGDLPTQGCSTENPVDVWEKSIDSFLLAGKYHHDLKGNGIRFASHEVRKFSGKNLPRLNAQFKQELETRYKAAGWKTASFYSSDSIRLSR